MLTGLSAALKQYFDPADGQLPQRLERLLKRDGDLENLLGRHLNGDGSTLARTLATHIGEQSPLLRMLSPKQSDGILNALTDVLTQSLQQQRDHVISQFSLDKPESALSRLIGQITDANGRFRSDLATDLTKVCAEFSLDNEDGALARLVRQVERAQRSIVEQFSMDNDDSALRRMCKLMETTNATVKANLTLDDENSPLACLRRELMQLLADQNKVSVSFQSEIRTTLEGFKVRRDDAAKSTVHGGDFEDAAGAFLCQESQRVGDIFEHVGNTSGTKSRCKTGDYVVTLGPESAAPGSRIVFEAKSDKSYTLVSALEEIREARENRDAEVGTIVPSFSVFRDSVVRNLGPDGLDLIEAKRDLASRWLEIHETRELGAEELRFGSAYGLGSAPILALAESSDFKDDLFRWASSVYRPALAIRVTRNDRVVGAYLLFGQEQLDDHVTAYAWLDEIGVALSEALLPPSQLVEDATRRESLRRLSWVMHQLNGPVGRAQRAMEDILEFLGGHPELADKLIPDDEKAIRRARMPGGAVLACQTMGARVGDAMKAIGDVRKITYQVRRLKRVQGNLPQTAFSLSFLLKSRCESCVGQLPGLDIDCQELSDVNVVANRDSIGEAIDEVLNNACREFRERKVHEPRLTLKCWREHDTAWLTISDNALPLTIRLIADPFEEDASTYASSGRGTGLGLAIVRETFRGHGGACSLTENVEGDERVSGVTFSASLPIRPADQVKGVRNGN